MKKATFEYVERQVRKQSYAVISAVDSQGRPHSTGIIYGVAAPGDPFALYMISEGTYAKVHNLRRNPLSSLVIPFPHHWIRMAPANTVMFRGRAQILPFEDLGGQRAFRRGMVQRFLLRTSHEKAFPDLVFIRLDPEPQVFCYGLGIPLLRLQSNIESAGYKVRIPEDRLRQNRTADEEQSK